MKLPVAAGLFLLSLLFLSSCYYDKEDKLYEQYYKDKMCDSVNMTYSKNIEPVIAGKCATTGCHVAGGTGNGMFDNYAGVKAKVDNGSMLQRTIITMDMPPSTPLSYCELLQMRKWMEMGAPNN